MFFQSDYSEEGSPYPKSGLNSPPNLHKIASKSYFETLLRTSLTLTGVHSSENAFQIVFALVDYQGYKKDF